MAGSATPAPAQELRGHGGPVRGIAIAADGQTAMTGSFDQSAILWRLDQATAVAVLRFHDGAVNAVLALPDGRFATGGEDGRIALWAGAAPAPMTVLQEHRGAIAALALSPDRQWLASASWDDSIRVTPVAGGPARVLQGHRGPVSAVAFLPDGRVVSGGHDATLRLWPAGEGPEQVITLESPLNALAAAPDGEIVAAGTDGRLHLFGPDGGARGAIEVTPTPLIALALSADGALIAAGGLRGQVPLILRRSRQIKATLVGPGLPVWSLAFYPNGRELLSGGADRLVRRWNAETGEHLGVVVPVAGPSVMAGLGDERGAQLFRACAACHTLTPEDGNRAGPTLHGIMGRRIATAAGYNFSPALKALDIVWSKETISRLFEIGPNAYTPGTKMPEQTITTPEDRQALVEWLEKATAPKP